MNTRILLMFLSIIISGVTLAQEKPFFEKYVVWEHMEDGLAPYRLPDIMVAESGTVFAYSDARLKGGDGDPSHVVMKRSEDAGQSWGKPIYMARSENEENYLFPCMVQDRVSKRIFFFYTSRSTKMVDHSEMYVRSSSDDGKTWSNPVIVDDVVKEKDKQLQKDLANNSAPFQYEKENEPYYGRKFIFAGPGSGIQLRGDHPIAPNRMIIPLFLLKDRWGDIGERGYGNGILYSDDEGKTWLAGGIVPLGRYLSSEVSIIEMNNGDILMNSRIGWHEEINEKRTITVSHNGGITWTEPILDYSGIPQSVRTGNGLERWTFAQDDRNNTNRILYSFPNNIHKGPGIGNARSTMTVLMSYDEHRTWPINKGINGNGMAGYSNMASLPDGKMLLIYDGGLDESDKERKVIVAKFNLEWLTDGKDSMKKGRKK